MLESSTASFVEIQAMVIALITLLIGAHYFFLPQRAFSFIGLEPVKKHPEAFGEARSTFAGFSVALGTMFLFSKEPILGVILGGAWGFAAFGKIIQILVDGAKHRSVVLRLMLSLYMCVGLLVFVKVPSIDVGFNVMASNIVPTISALITLAFGILCLLRPIPSANLMRIGEAPHIKGAVGEVRGVIAGFYIATALAALFVGGAYVFMALGLCWLMTAFGRMVSMLFDGTSNRFNWISLPIELGLACLPLMAAFGVI